MLQIICHYTFSSNEVNPIASFLMLLFMGIIGIVALRIWIGNKIDDRKLTVHLAKRDLALMGEAKEILDRESKNNERLRDVQFSMKYKDWFNKGYISGATHGNWYYGRIIKKSISEITVQEWENYQSGQMSLIKDDSDYFGGNKEMALYAYFEGHKYGYKRYCEKGAAD